MRNFYIYIFIALSLFAGVKAFDAVFDIFEWTCYNCHKVNSVHNDFCWNCGMPYKW